LPKISLVPMQGRVVQFAMIQDIEQPDDLPDILVLLYEDGSMFAGKCSDGFSVGCTTEMNRLHLMERIVED